MNKPSKKKEFDILKFGNEQAYINLKNKINQLNPKFITVDIFDTLLIRKTKSETKRFKNSSEIISNKFKLDLELVFNARMLAHKWCYNFNQNGEKEARFHDIISVMCQILSLKDDNIKQIIELELEYEKNDLMLNRELINLLKSIKNRILLLSDMYLSEKNILQLLKSLNFNLKFEKLFVSSEYQLSKRNGTFYDFLLKKYKKEGLHIGDNEISDIVMAKKYGFDTFHLKQHYG